MTEAPISIEGKRLTVLISNAHRLLKKRYRRSPLWSLVADLTGNGSTVAGQLCKQVGFDPCQPCGGKYLKSLSSSVEAAQSSEHIGGVVTGKLAHCECGAPYGHSIHSIHCPAHPDYSRI